jgi:predicted Fe-Mo cluster-binding NifX family protein
MKIAVPVAQGKLCLHFGHCEQFAIIEVDPETKSIKNKQMVTPPPHQPGVLPPWMAEQGVKLVIAGGMGARAIGLFNQLGVEVIVGAPSDDPEKIVMDYLNGTLQTGANVCDH